MADPLGLRIGGRYRLVRRLARGRGAELYLAERHGRAYALKLLDPGVQIAASSLRHPFVVPVHEVDLDRTTERVFVVMDLIEGHPLAQLTKQGPLPAPRATRLVRQLLQALEAAHAQNLVHGHLAPDKILVLGAGSPEEEIRLLGLGQASEVRLTRPAEAGFTEQVERLRRRIRRRDRRLATAVRLPPPRRPVVNRRSPVGAMLYAAPELLLERPFDHRADLYSAAAILYELLSGRPPIQPSPQAEDPEEELRLAIESKTPPLLHEEIALVPRQLSEAIAGSLSKSPGDRPGDARTLRKALRRAQDRIPVHLGPVRAPGTPPPLTVIPEPASPKPNRLVIRPKDLGGSSKSPLSVRLLSAAGLACGLLALIYSLTLSPPDPFLPPGDLRAAPAWSDSSTLLPAGVTWTREQEVYQGVKDGSLLVSLGSAASPPLFMSQHEVTWGQYRRYCAATGVEAPYGGGADLAPVTSVTRREANAYCAWAGGRLPTKDEFLAAAGPRPVSSGLISALRPVRDSAQVADPLGTFDLRANADEWLAGGLVVSSLGVTASDQDDRRDPRRGFRLVIAGPVPARPLAD